MISPVFIGGAATGSGITFVVCVFVPGVLRKIKSAFSQKTTAAKVAVAGVVSSVASDIKKV